MKLLCILLCVVFASGFYFDNNGTYEEKITGGNPVSIVDLPYQASVFQFGIYNVCGATIIHRSWVITAAHCLKNNLPISVRTGSGLRETLGKVHIVEKIIMHDDFDTNAKNNNDIALIKGCSERRGSPGKGAGSKGSRADVGHHPANGGAPSSSSSSSREHHDGCSRGGGDGDFIAHAASALRRFNFKSVGGSRTVPKLVVMGSSTASETTINTSTDSANTMVTMVTTTDGEQHDDSLDLMDVPPELSPPPVTDGPTHQQSYQHVNGISVTQTTVVVVNATSTSPSQQQQAKPCENGLPAMQINGTSATCATTNIIQNGHGGTGGVDSPDAPPPTPLIGSHQESRFNFPGGTEPQRPNRIPALPDLRAADFFSQPVRGSVDAGQPDPHQISSMLALVAAKDKQFQDQQQQPPQSKHKNSSASTISTSSSTITPTSSHQNCSSSSASSGIHNNNNNNNDSSSSSNGTVPKLVNGHHELRSPVDSKPPRSCCGASATSSSSTTSKPNINVTTNPLDISLCVPQAPAATGARGRNSRSGPGGNTAGGKRTTQATIVVQQPSLSLDAPAATILLRPTQDADARRREENMKQLLEVADRMTLQDIHDFEMKYGSPHHSRSHSVKTPGSRASGRPNYLCLPQQRSRVASMPNTGSEEEYYRQRHFSITTKGVINRGDSLKSRRSRSNNSVASSNSSTEHLTASYPGSARNSAAGSLASSRESSASQGPAPYRVLMLGGPSVGKSSLVSQFMTSEYLHAYDTSIDDESGEKTVTVLLAGEESELTFIDHPYAEMSPEQCISTYEPHGYCVVYSTTDRASARIAEEVLQTLWRSDRIPARAVILVGNKTDLARSRLVSTEEGKMMAISYDCKFIETSVGINHNVDELLVGLLTQIRLKLENPERNRDLFRRRSRRNRSRSPLGSCSENNSPKKYRGSRTSASLKVRNLLGKVWARDSKSKSCENLHVL